LAKHLHLLLGPSPFVALGVLLLCAAPWAVARAQGSEPNELVARAVASARSGDLAQLQRALEAGASIDTRSRIGDSLLLIAIKGEHTPYALQALTRGADPQRANAAGVTPLMAAAFQGNTVVLRALLDRQVPLDPVDRVQKTAMVYAAGAGRSEAVGLLLDAGVKVDARYDAQLTALMWAAGMGQEQTVRLLLQRGANAALSDDRGKTALQMAREAGHAAVADLLETAH
jgi:ankyrin repeat protein